MPTSLWLTKSLWNVDGVIPKHFYQFMTKSEMSMSVEPVVTSLDTSLLGPLKNTGLHIIKQSRSLGRRKWRKSFGDGMFRYRGKLPSCPSFREFVQSFHEKLSPPVRGV